MSKYFALTHPCYPKDVRILAERIGGGGEFSCVNGAWSGRFENNRVIIDEDDASARRGITFDPIPAIVVWEGDWPKGCRDYNDAIEWIKGQL